MSPVTRTKGLGSASISIDNEENANAGTSARNNVPPINENGITNEVVEMLMQQVSQLKEKVSNLGQEVDRLNIENHTLREERDARMAVTIEPPPIPPSSSASLSLGGERSIFPSNTTSTVMAATSNNPPSTPPITQGTVMGGMTAADYRVEKLPYAGTMTFFSGDKVCPDGTPAVTLEEFHHRLCNYAFIHNDTQKYFTAVKFLRGEALGVVTDATLKANPSWDLLRGILEKRFPTHVEASTQVFGMRRQPGQGVGDYIRSLGERLSHLPDVKRRETLLQKLSGELPESAFNIYENNPEAPLGKIARQIENHLQLFPQYGLTQQHIESEKKKSIHPRVAMATPRSHSRYNPYHGRPILTCWTCKGSGHKRSQCPTSSKNLKGSYSNHQPRHKSPTPEREGSRPVVVE